MKPMTWRDRASVLAIILLAWALRWILLMDAPPGWRDDDLIELYTFSARIVEEGPVLYFPGASGHEPLYHTLRAPIIAAAGINQASARWISAASGTLTALLVWAIGRQLIGHKAGLTASAVTAVSFWSLMYSRVAIRHMGVLPWALLAIYWAWRLLRSPTLTRRAVLSAVSGIMLGTAGALLTYYAGRLLPVLLIAAYPIASPRRGRWRAYAVGIALGLALALPMFWTAAHLPGADARVSELALPIHALQEGNPVPLLQTAWTTLGMAHAQGDPEWLYNISERPVFGILGSAAFYLALAIAVIRWRQPASRLLLLWLGAGIGPALISLPPSSYGHTILALPAVYLLLASLVTVGETGITPRLTSPFTRSRQRLALAVAAALIVMVAARDIPDYFITWSQASMVRFLYRADYRALSDHLSDGTANMKSAAIGSMLFGPWDKVALATDTGVAGSLLRWVDSRRALVFVQNAPTNTYIPDVLARDLTAPLKTVLAVSESIAAPEGIHGYQVAPVTAGDGAIYHATDGVLLAESAYADALALEAVEIWNTGSADASLWLATWWAVQSPLPLPEEELIPNPPPPGIYSGPRLKVFTHLSAGENIISIDDGLWVDPYSLSPGDVVLQFHTFTVPEEVTAPLTLQIGLYDPMTGTRWTTTTGADYLELTLD